MEDDSSTFLSLFEELCLNAFRHLNGHAALQRGLSEIIVSGTLLP